MSQSLAQWKELKQDHTVIDQLEECLQLAWLPEFYSAY